MILQIPKIWMFCRRFRHKDWLCTFMRKEFPNWATFQTCWRRFMKSITLDLRISARGRLEFANRTTSFSQGCAKVLLINHYQFFTHNIETTCFQPLVKSWNPMIWKPYYWETRTQTLDLKSYEHYNLELIRKKDFCFAIFATWNRPGLLASMI